MEHTLLRVCIHRKCVRRNRFFATGLMPAPVRWRSPRASLRYARQLDRLGALRGRSSGVEHRLPKPCVVGSNPIARSIFSLTTFASLKSARGEHSSAGPCPCEPVGFDLGPLGCSRNSNVPVGHEMSVPTSSARRGFCRNDLSIASRHLGPYDLAEVKASSSA